MNNSIKYIFVDLDGTLVRTDLFIQAVLKLLKQNFFYIFQLFFWALQGKAVAKEKVAKLVTINPESLPYETELIDYLRKQKNKIIVLATASNEIYANSVAGYLGIFDKVIASDKTKNLKGRDKLAAIHAMIGNEGFIYAGDSYADRPIWQAANLNIFVNAPGRIIEKARSEGKVEKIFNSTNQPIGKAFVKEMRFYQWVKNILVFVPLFTSHNYQDVSSVVAASIAFLCFGLCASGVYFLNDMIDLDTDRKHERKKFRPLAAGDLPLPLGVAGAIIFPIMALAIALYTLPLVFFGILILYYATTNTYSFFLKSVATADVITLAILYTLRIIAGAVAIDVSISSWLMAFSIFVFASLAYLKRYIEISALSEETDEENGRGYTASDSETLFSLGISNITSSVMVLALYINSDEVIGLYKTPEVLWLLCLLMLYWSNRIWVGARRGKIHDDPIIFAMRDKVSRMVAIFFLLVVLIAKYF